VVMMVKLWSHSSNGGYGSFKNERRVLVIHFRFVG
jgi:hypothetical protein